MSVVVAIERRQVVLAKQLTDAIDASGTTKRRANYTGLEAENRHFTGFCGQAAVVNWLRAEKVVFQLVMGDTHRREANEIRVWHKTLRRRIEVKTASQPEHRMLMVPARQFDTEPADFYVAARLETDPARLLEPLEPLRDGEIAYDEADKVYAAATILGWLDRDAVARLPVRRFQIPTRVCDFVMLRHPNELTRELDHGGEIRE